VNLLGLALIVVLSVVSILVVRRLAEKERAYVGDLERSNQELDDFAYIASHDLKEPLRGLFNHATFLLEDYSDKIDEDGVRRLNRLGALCQRMERLINDLMYFSRLGRADLAIQSTDPNAIIVEIRQMMETLLSERGARIIVPHTLPLMVCDKIRVTEVFRNLITNAVKYNDKPERLVEVGFLESAITDTGPEKTVFYVRDNGVGIEREFHQEIFRIFKRLQNTPDGQEAGTGVGLTFVKKIVERHGGRIWLDSESGKGTVFYFNLNCERNEPARNSHASAIDPIPVHSAG
jgi:light-regulated signal transduction histidine kinase (bacteriophytochrome)